MSTKIYNAYRMKGMSVLEMDEFVKDLKSACIKNGKEMLKKRIAEISCEIIDMCCMYRADEEITKLLYSDAKKRIKTIYQGAKTSVNRKLSGTDPEYDEKKMIDELDKYRMFHVFHLCKEYVINKAKYAEVLKTIKYSAYDVTSDMVVFSVNRNKTLLMAFGELSDLMSTIVSSKEGDEWYDLKTKYRISDYHYQNQTDRPKELSAREWNRRKKDWDQVMPTGIPSRDGTVIQLVDADQIESELVFEKENSIMKYVKTYEQRTHEAAKMIVRCRHYSNDMSKYLSTINQIEKEIAKKNGNYYEEYSKTREVLNGILIEIDEEVLAKSIPQLCGWK